MVNFLKHLKSIVKFYSDDIPLFDHFAITKQVKSLFGRTVSFKRGAYLILEKTEAMFVIDVNSGTRTRSNQTQEENALEVNLAAGTEIARQLRLRDIGGIIVVDFIDMVEGAHRNQLFDHMQEVMKNDRAKHNILPLSKFGLMQITRQRVRPVLEVETKEVCPTCNGTGKSTPSILLVDKIEEYIGIIKEVYRLNNIKIEVNPYIDAYIKKGLYSEYVKWKLKYGMGIKVIPRQDFGFLEYRFLDNQGDELILKNLPNGE